MEVADRRLQKAQKAAKGGDKAALGEAALLEKLIAHLEEGKCARLFPVDSEEDKAFLASCNLLTYKPVLYAANVKEDDLATGNEYVERVKRFAAEEGSEAFHRPVPRSSKEIAELER